MAQTALNLGVATTMLQNRSYALPARKVTIQSNVVIESSTDETTWAALTGANTVGAETAARFVRCATGAAVVICKV